MEIHGNNIDIILNNNEYTDLSKAEEWYQGRAISGVADDLLPINTEPFWAIGQALLGLGQLGIGALIIWFSGGSLVTFGGIGLCVSGWNTIADAKGDISGTYDWPVIPFTIDPRVPGYIVPK